MVLLIALVLTKRSLIFALGADGYLLLLPQITTLLKSLSKNLSNFRESWNQGLAALWVLWHSLNAAQSVDFAEQTKHKSDAKFSTFLFRSVAQCAMLSKVRRPQEGLKRGSQIWLSQRRLGLESCNRSSITSNVLQLNMWVLVPEKIASKSCLTPFHMRRT